MVSANNMVSPISNWRPGTPYDYNGSADGAHCSGGECEGYGLAQVSKPRRTKDIGEGKIDPEVHGMASANNMVSPISNWRPDAPYDDNGSADGAHCSGGECPDVFAQKPRRTKDIGEGGIDAEVHGMASANNMV